MVAARGRGRKVKKEAVQRVTLEQRSWVQGAIAMQALQQAKGAAVADLQEVFKAKFGRNLSKFTLIRIKKKLEVKEEPAPRRLGRPPKKKEDRGRPAATNRREDQLIVELVEENNRLPWNEI
jgi:hypothetical protein